MSDIGCPGREFQVRADLHISEEDPQNRKPQQHHRKQGRYDDGTSHDPNDWNYILSPVYMQSLTFVRGQIIGETGLDLIEGGSSFAGRMYRVSGLAFNNHVNLP
ncbi:MAG: hypothetical protein JW896_09780 [Deltaproteobacteria bacterium]|nr:hypothetical protein [Deltaproteobacteria bacterium]